MSVTGDDYCFVCGPLNELGLHLKFETEENGVSRTVWTPDKMHQGYVNLTHGGLIATVLDECMVRMLWHLDVPAVTARFELELKLPAPVGEPLYCEGRVVRDRGKVLECTAEARNEAGDIVALAKSKSVVQGKRNPQRLGEGIEK